MLSMREYHRLHRERNQRQWESDINSYHRWKKLRDKWAAIYPESKLIANTQKRMDDIKARWPKHTKHFD